MKIKICLNYSEAGHLAHTNKKAIGLVQGIHSHEQVVQIVTSTQNSSLISELFPSAIISGDSSLDIHIFTVRNISIEAIESTLMLLEKNRLSLLINLKIWIYYNTSLLVVSLIMATTENAWIFLLILTVLFNALFLTSLKKIT